MKIISADVRPSVETETGPDGRAGRTSVEATVTFRVVPDSVDDANLLMGDGRGHAPMGLMMLQWIQAIVGSIPTDELTLPSSPYSVVSVRPQIDGAASASMIIRPGETELMPLALVAIGPSGDLVKLSVPLEIRATVQ